MITLYLSAIVLVAAFIWWAAGIIIDALKRRKQ